MGIFLALLTALLEACKDVVSKIAVSTKRIDVYYAAFAHHLVALLLMFCLLPWIPLTGLSHEFYLGALIKAPIMLIITPLLMWAWKLSDMSLVSPMIALTPLFMLVTTPFIVGETIHAYGAIGVIVIVIGIYVLSIENTDGKVSLLGPLRLFKIEKGMQLMLLVAFLWAITSNIDAIGINNGGFEKAPLAWVLVTEFVITLLFIPLIYCRYKCTGTKITFSEAKSLIPIGVFSLFAQIAQMVAVSIFSVVYVIAIKRTSILFSTLFGIFHFNEGNLKSRLPGVIIIITGAMLIILLA